MIDFKPSQIDPFLRSALPFVATFNHSESEIFAAMLVGALATNGDEWKPIEPRAVGIWLRDVIMIDPEQKKIWEGFVAISRPYPRTLVKEGFCRFIGADVDHAAIEFTEKGLEALRRWVAPPSVLA